MAAVIAGNGLGLFNSSLQVGLGLGSGARLGLQGGDRQYVNISNGNLILHSQDEQLLFRGMTLGQFRTYNSQGLSSQTGSDGWVTGFERRIELLSGTVGAAGSVMRLHTGDGSWQDFTHTGGNTYQSTSGDGAHDTLTYAAGSKTWTYVEGSSRREETYADHANATLKGRLTRIRDLLGDATNPTTWDVLYDGAGRITQVRSKDTGAGATPDALVFTYDAAGRLATLSTRENGVLIGQVSYGYDSIGRLSSVLVDLTPRDGAGDQDTWNANDAASNDGYLYRTVYSYVDDTSLRISQVRQGDGTLVSYGYDAEGRVVSVTQGDDNADDSDGIGQTLTYSYDPVNRRTDVSDSSGRTWTYGYDAEGRLTEVQGPAVEGQRDVSHYSYDTDGNLVQAQTLRAGVVLSQADYQYDTQGNLVWQWNVVDPANGSAATAIQRTYTANNQLASETVFTGLDADGAGSASTPQGGATVHYLRDAQGRVRFTVSATGEVTETRYATSGAAVGQPESVRRYLGERYSGDYTTADLEAWATEARRAESGLTEYSYDLRGRLNQTRGYSQVDETGAGVLDDSTEVVNYVYDAQGLLREKVITRYPQGRLDDSEAVSEAVSYVYDGMGRLLSEVVQERRYFGGTLSDTVTLRTTTWAYQDSGSTLRTTIEAGVAGDGTGNDLQRTEVRNAAGQLIAVTESLVAGGSPVRTTHHYYDSTGRLRASEDANGARTYFFYDAEGQLAGQVDATGTVVTYLRDPLGRIVSTTAHATQISTAGWLVDGVVVPVDLSTVVPVGTAQDRTALTQYDALGRKISEIDGEGGITTYLYDGAGRLVETRATDALGTAATARVQRFFYDAAGREAGRLDAAGYLTEFVYDAGGRLARTVVYATATAVADRAPGTLDDLRPQSTLDDAVTRNYYDGRGNLIGQLDAEGYLTEYIYDQARNQRGVQSYGLQLDASQADAGFAVLRGLAQDGGSVRTTLRSYNAMGQLSVEVSPEGRVTRFEYDDQGNLIHTTSAADTDDVRHAVKRYDAFGNLVAELNGEGSALYISGMDAAELEALYSQYGIRHIYDAVGRRIESIDAEGNRTWYFYDAVGRPTHTVYGVEDANGLRNAEGEVEETRYDAFGQARETIRYTGRVLIGVPFGREEAAQAIQALQYIATIDSRQQYKYDRRGLVTERISAEGYRSTMAYNAFGQLVQQQDQIGTNSWRVTESGYDARGQRTSLTEDATGLGRITTAQYDAFGRVTQSTDGRGTATFYGYDRMGRQVAVERSVSGRVERAETAYDAWGRVVSQVDALGRVTQFVHDDQMNSMTMTTPEGLVVVSTYNLHGQAVEILRQDGKWQRFEYDSEGRLIADEFGENDLRDGGSYFEYDRRGMLLLATEGTSDIAYRYDARGRVIERAVASWTEEWIDTDGDGWEDPVRTLTPLPGTTYRYDGQGRQLTITDAAGVQTALRYDRDGRLLESVLDPDGAALTTTYTWDGLGRQLTVTEAAGTGVATVTAYTYDGLGRRTSEVRAAGSLDLTTTYYYDANDNVVATEDAAQQVTRFVYDEANRVVLTVDARGAVTEYRYDAAGQRVSSRIYATPIPVVGLGVVTTEASIRPNLSANDARDRQSYYQYDADGRQTVVIDGAGGVTVRIFDVSGNVSQVRAYANGLTLDGSLRQALSDGAVSEAAIRQSITADDARDRLDSYLYDGAGRQIGHLDPYGYYTESSYDSYGLLVAQQRTAQPLSWSLHADFAAGGVRGETSEGYYYFDHINTGDSRTEYLYDASGRLQFKLTYVRTNAQEYWTQAANSVQIERMVYDAAGRLVAEITYGVSPQIYWPTRMAAGRAAPGDAYTAPAILDWLDQESGGAVDDLPQRKTQYIRDSAGRTHYSIGPDGLVQEYIYDALGQVVETRQYGERIEVRSWEEAELSAHLAGIADVRVTRQEYDEAGNVVARYDALQAVERFVYDAVGQLISYTDKNQAVWTYQYDAVGNRTSETSPQVVVARADVNGNLSSTVRSIVTVIEYDVFGNVTRRIEDLGTATARATEYEYNNRGLQVLTRYPDAGAMGSDGQVQASGVRPTTEVTYDALGRAVMQRDVLGYYSYKTYDSAGRVRFDIDAEGYVSEYGYDALGQQTRLMRYASPVTISAGSAPTSADVESMIVARPGEDRLILTRYDVAGRKWQVVQVDMRPSMWGEGLEPNYGKTTEFEYNVYGDVIAERSTTDAEGYYLEEGYVNLQQGEAEVRYFYDAAGRRSHRIDAAGYVTAWDYDVAGNLVRETQYALAGDGAPPEDDGNGGGGGWESFQAQSPFDPLFAGHNRVTEWDYDVLGRKVAERTFIGNPDDGMFVESLTEYDANGQATAAVVLGERTQTYYDALGRVTAVRESERDVVQGNSDIQLGSTGVNLQSQQLYRRASPYSTMAYDAFGNVVQVRRYADGADPGQVGVASSRDQVISTLYDWQGRSVLERDATGTLHARTYDAADRLLATRSRLDGNSGRWSLVVNEAIYDKVGRQVISKVSREMHQGEGSPVLAVEIDATSQVRYNAFGEIIAKDTRLDSSLATSDFAAQYVYDEQGNLVASNAEGGVMRHYTYDRAGRAIKEVHSVRISDTEVVDVETRMEYDLRGNLITQYLPSNDDRANGEVTIGRTYDAWGNVLSATDQRGGTTWYEYNERSQIVREVKPEVKVVDSHGVQTFEKPETVWEYDALGRLTGTRDANGNWQRSSYDASGRLIYSETATGNRTYSAYDAFGQKRYTQSPLNYLTFMEYDQGGRVVAQGDFLTEADGQTRAKAVRERYAVNQNGNRLRVTDALGYVNTFDYDSRGLVTRSLTAAGVAMSYGYDAQGNKIRATNALSDANLAADGVPVFNGGIVGSQPVLVGQSVSLTIPAGAFSTSDGEQPSITVRVTYKSSSTAEIDVTGFTYDPQTRTVTGIPAQTGTYSIIITATSASGKTVQTTATVNSVSQTAYNNFYSNAPKANLGLLNQVVAPGQGFSYQIPSGTFTEAPGQGITYQAYVTKTVSTYDAELRRTVTERIQVAVGSAEDDSGLSFNPSTGVLSGAMSSVGTRSVTIEAKGANGRSTSVTLNIIAQQPSGRQTVVDSEGEVVFLNELTWKYDYFGRLQDHNDLSGADYDYSYDPVTGQLLGENSKWTEEGKSYSTPVNDYWYERDWQEYGMDSGLVEYDLPPELLNDPAREYSYYRSGALKELREGQNWFRYDYDAAGNRTLEEAYTRDADGTVLHVVTRVTYDAHGRITKVIQHDEANDRRLLELGYDYDAVGNRRRVSANTAYDATAPGIDINGITNPDFESGDYGWIRGEGWSVVNGGEGNSTLRAQYSFTGGSTIVNKQRVEVRPGETITASVRVDQGASSAGEAGAAVFIQWYDYAGNPLSVSEGNMVDSASGGSIYDSRVRDQVPPGAVFMSIGARAFRSGGGDPLFIDNFTWGASPNNGDLASASGWTYEPGVSWTTEYNGALMFNRDATTRAVNNDRVAVQAGSMVNARANVQQGASSAGEAWGAVFLTFYDANGNVIAEEVGNRVDSGSGGEWHSSYVTKRVPPGAVEMSVGGMGGGAAGKPLWMDDFSWNYEREGELDPGSTFVDPDPSDPYTLKGAKDYWYEYDANNQVKVANGKMNANGQIVLGSADISYALDYDEAGRAVRRRYLSGLVEVSEMTQYDERGQRLRVFQSTELGGGGQAALKEAYTYDAVGRVVEQRTYFDNGSTQNGVNISGWLKHGETFTYDADGRIKQQIVMGREVGWTAAAQSDGGAFQTTNLRSLQYLSTVTYSGYDRAGNLMGYSYRYITHEAGSGAAASDPKGYTHTYIYSYEARDGYLEARVTGHSTNQNFRASTTYSTYDAWGRRVAVRENTPLASNLGTLDDRIRYFSYDGTGNILQRREGSLKNGQFEQDAGQATQNQIYAYVGGQLVASGKRSGEVDVVGRLTACQSNNAAGSSRTTVLAGETLRGIAQRVYGNANLWYVLAEANAITDDSGLTAGTTLVVPEVKVTANDATTFKPFSPQEAIGNTAPNLPYIEPPPKEHCNGFAMVLMVVVAVVATIFTAGAALTAIAAMAPSLGIVTAGGVMATGAAVLAGTVTVTGTAMLGAAAAVAGAAFAGGMAGSIASQAVGKAMGVVDSFSLRSAVAGGIGSMLTAGVGSSATVGGMATAGAASAVGAYVGGKIAGVPDTHFSWRAVAASAVSSVVSAKINSTIGSPFGDSAAGAIANKTLTGTVGGVVSLHTRRQFGLGGDINYGSIAADAFGNALGNSAVSSMAGPRASAPVREGIPIQRSALSGSEVGDVSPMPIDVDSQVAGTSPIGDVVYRRSAEYIPTLDTVTARPYGEGWYFYRWDGANKMWVDLQRSQRPAPAQVAGVRPAWWNSYGASPNGIGQWRMMGASSAPTRSNLPGLVNRGFSLGTSHASGSGLGLSDLSEIANNVNFATGQIETVITRGAQAPAVAGLWTKEGVNRHGISLILNSDLETSSKIYGPYAETSKMLTESIGRYSGALKGVAVVGNAAMVVDSAAYVYSKPEEKRLAATIAVATDATGGALATWGGGVAGGALGGVVVGSSTGPFAPYAVPVFAAGGAIAGAWGWNLFASPSIRDLDYQPDTSGWPMNQKYAQHYWGMPQADTQVRATTSNPVAASDKSPGWPMDQKYAQNYWGMPQPKANEKVPMNARVAAPAESVKVPWYSDPKNVRHYWGMPQK